MDSVYGLGPGDTVTVGPDCGLRWATTALFESTEVRPGNGGWVHLDGCYVVDGQPTTVYVVASRVTIWRKALQSAPAPAALSRDMS